MSQKPAAETPRRPARDLIDAVVDHMRKNVEPLKYSTLVPSRYTVYLHPAEFTRLEGIVPVLQEQTARALGEALESMNRRSSFPLTKSRNSWGSIVEVARSGPAISCMLPRARQDLPRES